MSRVMAGSADGGSSKRKAFSDYRDLFDACEEGDYQRVAVYIVQGFDIEVRGDQNRTPLMVASIYGHSDIVADLIQHGMDVNARDFNDWTALALACHMAREETVRVLLAAKADVNLGVSPLILACMEVPHEAQHLVQIHGFWQRKFDIVSELLQARADAEAMIGSKKAVDIARSNNQSKIVALLENEVDDTTTALATSKSIVSATSSKKKQQQVLKEQEKQVLFSACANGDFQQLEYLITQGFNLDVRSDCGQTVLMFAIMYDQSKIALALIDLGVSVNALDNRKWTALAWAANFARRESIRLLLARGAKADLGLPLIAACSDVPEKHLHLIQLQNLWNRKFEIVRELLDAGADVEAKDDVTGVRVLDLARSQKQPKIAALLSLPSSQKTSTTSKITAAVAAVAAAGAGGGGGKTKANFCEGCNVALPSQAKLCGGCHKARYCTKECQTKHWSIHKKECQKTAGGAVVVAKKKATKDKQVEEKATEGDDLHDNDVLMNACKKGVLQQVETCIAQGFDLNVYSDYGFTPLMYASIHNFPQIASVLIEHGADINLLTGKATEQVEEEKTEKDLKSSSFTALYLACAFDRLEVARLLLARGANANLGISALVAACSDIPERIRDSMQLDGIWNRKFQMAQALLEAGAEVEKHAQVSGGLTALEAAKQSNQPQIVALLEQHLQSVESNATRKRAAVIIQSAFRTLFVFKKHKGPLAARRDLRKKWIAIVKALKRSKAEGAKAFSWFDEKAQLEIYEEIDDENAQKWAAEDKEEERKEEEADEEEEKEREAAHERNSATPRSPSSSSPSPSVAKNVASVVQIELAHSVFKWLEKKPDAFLLGLFYQRIEALSKGFESYALKKRLKTSSSKLVPIFESKIVAGFRMLWTILHRRTTIDGDASNVVVSKSILVWYVCAHDRVPRNIENIERAYARVVHHTLPDACLEEGGRGGSCSEGDEMIEDEEIGHVSIALSERTVLLDPQSNSPLKTFVVSALDLEKLSCSISSSEASQDQRQWLPPLRLTQREREINSTKGAILILGRSGTGKSTSIVARMVSDHEAATNRGSPYVQLFVTRMKRLCNETKRNVQQQVRDEAASPVTQHFLQLSVFLDRMERALLAAASAKEEVEDDEHRPHERLFLRRDRVEFARFRDLIFPALAFSTSKKKKQQMHQDPSSPAASSHCLDPLLVWTHIKSFIKGSIKAAMQYAPLSLEQYLEPSTCAGQHLSEEQKRECFSLFLRYQEVLQEQQLWDDGDRVLALHEARAKTFDLTSIDFTLASLGAPSHFNAIYVDEIQDCTQAEIALFFLAAGPNTDKDKTLMLAGDPAQSVVEGVVFSFEFVRSVVYELSSGKERIEKPHLLEVNFRSHAGILNVAALVLDKMLAHFPDSARKFAKDVGLYLGPRPNYLQLESTEALADILEHNERLVLLTNDEWAKELAVQVRRQDAMFGIREAKGLEFKDVMIVDFFSQLSSDDQTAWKHMLIDAKGAAAGGEGAAFDAPPQLEPQLKLLYTALTRACDRLIFVETQPSKAKAGRAFFRVLKDTGLAEPYPPTAKDEHVLMTSDEWKKRGAEIASAHYDASENLDALAAAPEEAAKALERAQVCFARCGNARLVELANLQQEFLQHAHALRQAAWHRASNSSASAFASVVDECDSESLTDNERVYLILLCVQHGLLDEANFLLENTLHLVGEQEREFVYELMRTVD